MKKVKNIFKETSALVWREDSLYVAKSLEVEIASQGANKKEALENLKEALELYKDLSLEKLNIAYA